MTEIPKSEKLRLCPLNEHNQCICIGCRGKQEELDKAKTKLEETKKVWSDELDYFSAKIEKKDAALKVAKEALKAMSRGLFSARNAQEISKQTLSQIDEVLK